eukprot:g20231.t1
MPQMPEESEPSLNLTSEVSRIRLAAVDDYREILGLSQEGDLELSAVQSKYRQIMRLLHPDKRDASMGAASQTACDEAMERVQQALQGLKKERLLRSRGAFKHSAPFVKDSTREFFTSERQEQDRPHARRRQATDAVSHASLSFAEFLGRAEPTGEANSRRRSEEMS